MGILDNLFKKSAGLINVSDVSSRIKPVFEGAYSVCREFGHRDGNTANIYYSNKLINIRHNYLGGSMDAFSPGKSVEISFKGNPVFACTFRKDGNIFLEREEKGDWKEYFRVLQSRVKKTIQARYICLDVYQLVEALHSKGYASSEYSVYRTPPDYSLERRRYHYTFSDRDIVIHLFHDDTKVASSAKIVYKGKEVFNATHYYPDPLRMFSSNTRCDLYIRGAWENSFSSIKNRYHLVY